MGESALYPFHIRIKLAKKFEEWADENGVAKCAESVIAYLCMKDLLSYKDVKAFLNNLEKDGAE